MFNAQPPAHPTSIPSINCSDGVSRGLGCSPQRVPCEVPRHTCTQQGATHDAIHNASRTKAVSRKSPLYSLTSNGEATTPALGHRIIGRVNSVRSLTLVPTNMSLLVGRRSAHLPIPPEMEQSVRVYRPFGRTSLTHTHGLQAHCFKELNAHPKQVFVQYQISSAGCSRPCIIRPFVLLHTSLAEAVTYTTTTTTTTAVTINGVWMPSHIPDRPKNRAGGGANVKNEKRECLGVASSTVERRLQRRPRRRRCRRSESRGFPTVEVATW